MRSKAAVLVIAFSAMSTPLANTSAQTGSRALGGKLVAPGYYDNIPQAARQIGNELPAVDLSAFLPPPGDQGQQGSCTAWATTYAARTYMDGRRPDRLAPLRLTAQSSQFSPAFVYNSVRFQWDRGRCDGQSGMSILEALTFLREVGSTRLSDFPYDDRDCNRQADSAILSVARGGRIRGFEIIGQSGNVSLQRMRQMISAGRPVIVSMVVDTDFMAYRGGIFDGGSRQGGNHAMVVVGYDVRKGAFKIMNSWGTRWGEAGFAWVTEGAMTRMLNEAYVISGEIQPAGKSLESVDPKLREDYHDFVRSAWEGNVAAVRAGIARGLRGDVEYKGDTALTEAVSMNRLDIVRLLLAAGADPNVGAKGAGALSLVTGYQADYEPSEGEERVGRAVPVKIASLLLEYGARVNMLDERGYSLMCSLNPEDGPIYQLFRNAGGKCLRPPIAFGTGR